MPRYKLVIAYDGTTYKGWQKQPGRKTIQGTLEGAIFNLFGSHVDVVGSGRTDAGVHALAQTAHIDLSLTIAPSSLRAALNSRMPGDIRVRQAEMVPETFHSRFSATKRVYAYLIRMAPEPSPFFTNYALQVSLKLDVDAMRQAAGMLMGTHDFSAFRATGGGHTLSTRRVFKSDLFYVSGHILCYLIVADAFLRKMVRGIVGTLLEIGSGKSDPYRMSQLLNTGDRSLIGKLAPPQGLYLAAVSYT